MEDLKYWESGLKHCDVLVGVCLMTMMEFGSFKKEQIKVDLSVYLCEDKCMQDVGI